jgi:hypothetical protein
LICAALVAYACGASTAPTPTPDAAQTYRSMVHAYYFKYETAKGDAYDFCVVGTDAPKCDERGTLMIGVWQSFLKSLDLKPAPSRFAADDAAFRGHIPKAISDLQRMVAAAKAGDHYPMVDAAGNYVGDMIPIVTDALHDVDPIWPIEH